MSAREAALIRFVRLAFPNDGFTVSDLTDVLQRAPSWMPDRPEIAQAALDVIAAAEAVPHHSWLTGSLRRLAGKGLVEYVPSRQTFKGTAPGRPNGWSWDPAYWYWEGKET